MTKQKAQPVRRIVPTACSPRRNPHFPTAPTKPLLARSTIASLVRELVAERCGRYEMRVARGAVEVLAGSAEAFLQDCYNYAHVFLNHRNGRAFTQRDLRLGVEVVTAHMDLELPWPDRVLERKHIHERHTEEAASVQRYVSEARRVVLAVPSTSTAI